MDLQQFKEAIDNKCLKIYSDPYNNVILLKEVQLDILDKIIEIENEIIKIKNKIRVIKEETKQLIQTIDEKRNNSILIKNLKYQIIDYKEEIKLIKEFVDGIAYSVFNKHDLKMLGNKQGSGFIGGKQGLKRELEIFNEVFSNGGIAILNDITNLIKFGDLTIYIDGRPILIEVKSSNNTNKRILRQKKAIKEKVEIILNDEIDNFLESKIRFRRVYIQNPEINYRNKLNELVETAYHNGVCMEEVEDGLYYFIAYKQASTEKFQKFCNRATVPMVFYLNAMKHRSKEDYTPFRALFKNKNTSDDFYNGDLIIVIIADFDVIRKELEKHGNKSTLGENYDIYIKFKQDDEEVEMIASNYHVFRIGRELLSLQWFVDGVNQVIKEI